MLSDRVINIREFPIHKMSFPFRMIAIGQSGSGKSVVMKAVINQFRDKVPICVAISPSELNNGFYGSIFPSLFVYEEFNEETIEAFLNRQDKAVSDPNIKNPSALLIMDDCSDEPKLLSKPKLQQIMKRGRHAKICFMLGLQYALDIKPSIRQGFQTIFIFREPNESARKKLYQNYASIAGSYTDFCDLMDQLTGDYTCLVIDSSSQSNDPADCIFYYKAPSWIINHKIDFGCEEYKQWGEARYNTGYKYGAM